MVLATALLLRSSTLHNLMKSAASKSVGAVPGLSGNFGHDGAPMGWLVASGREGGGSGGSKRGDGAASSFLACRLMKLVWPTRVALAPWSSIG
jgi:hypothetical protein